MRLSFYILILAGASATFRGTFTLAFSLSDHAAVAAIAVRELNACYPNTISAEAGVTLAAADLSEDIDFQQKVFGASHYYSPSENFQQRFRGNSQTRIKKLDVEIQAEVCDDDAIGLIVDLGRAIHHIQDMASPPHVMPVDHGLRDGFEKFPIRDIPSQAACEFDRLPDVTATDIHHSVARDTYEVVQHASPLAASGRGNLITWKDFWQPGTRGQFGAYGDAGNAFGSDSIQVKGESISIPRETYEKFKERQLRTAIEGTKRVLYEYMVRKRRACPHTCRFDTAREQLRRISRACCSY